MKIPIDAKPTQAITIRQPTRIEEHSVISTLFFITISVQCQLYSDENTAIRHPEKYCPDVFPNSQNLHEKKYMKAGKEN